MPVASPAATRLISGWEQPDATIFLTPLTLKIAAGLLGVPTGQAARNRLCKVHP